MFEGPVTGNIPEVLDNGEVTDGTHVTAGQLALALTPYAQVTDLAVNTAAAGNNAAAIQSLDDRVTAELASKLDSSALAPAIAPPSNGCGPGHHGRAGGRARKQHRRAAELADHGPLQQGRPVGLRRAGGRGGHQEHPGRRGPEAVQLQHHGGHERLHRLGQQRHALLGAVTAAALASELASRDASISGLQAPKADASALTAYALQLAVDTSSVVDSKIAAALLDAVTTAALDAALLGKADASALASLLSTVDGLPLDVDTKIANALLGLATEAFVAAQLASRDAGITALQASKADTALLASYATNAALSASETALQSALDAILAELAALQLSGSGVVNAPAWAGFTTWELLRGSSVVRNLHFVAPLSAALANGDDTLSITADCYSTAGTDAAITAALLAYYTSSQVDTLLGDYRTGTAQDAETTSAITGALLAYYTAAQVDALLGDYRTASAQDTQTQAAIAGALLAYRTGPDQDVFTTNQITSALVAYRSAADQDTATTSSIAAALLSYYTIAQVDGLLAGKLGVAEAASALQIAVRFPDDGGADEVVAAIGEQILGPTDVSLSNWTVRPSSGCSVVLATHTGVSVDGYTLTLAANPWNIVRTYNLTPGRELLFACRYRLGTPSNFVVYMSEADNVYDPLYGSFVGDQAAWSSQEAHGAVLLQRRVVAVHQVALRAQHAHGGVAPHAELSHLLGGDAEAPPVVAQHGVEVGAHLLHAQLQQLGQLPGHAERLVLEGARQHVLLAGQLEAHAPQAPHALAQERLHLRPGVPVARALGADHPVPLQVEEVGLVRELQDGAARIQRGLHLLPDPLRHLLLREVRRVPRGAAQLVHRQPVPALVARAGVPPAAPPATDDHRHVVLVVLVAEEALAQLGQPVLSALQGAHELLLPVAQQDVVVGPLSDEGLVVVEVLAGRPQAQVGVVVLARPGQLPVRAREQRVGPRAAPQVQHDGTIRPRASPGAAVRGLRDLLSLSRPTCHSFFTGPVFFGGPRILRICAGMAGELVSHGFALKKNAITAGCTCMSCSARVLKSPQTFLKGTPRS